MQLRTILVAIAAAMAAAPSGAADYSDPTWPCIQRKVGELSPALMWSGPLESEGIDAETAADADRLARTLALRRVNAAGMDAAIARFVEARGNDPALMGRVFSQVFEAVSGRRQRIMAGIEDYSLGQIDLSDRIDAARAEMDTEMSAEAPDFDQIDALEERIDWDERIYTDRQKSLTYVCETPVLLEQRLYTIAEKLKAAAGT